MVGHYEFAAWYRKGYGWGIPCRLKSAGRAKIFGGAREYFL
jgi:hypothetical protein